MIDPQIGSVWKVVDRNTIAVAVPTEFVVTDVRYESSFALDGSVERHKVIETMLGSFAYYFMLHELEEHYREVTDPDEIGWMALRNLP